MWSVGGVWAVGGVRAVEGVDIKFCKQNTAMLIVLRKI